MNRATKCFAALIAMSHGVALAQDVLIRGATVHTVTTQGTLSSADVLVRAGKIAQVGDHLVVPAGIRVIDAKGRPLTPGLFGGLSSIGLLEVSSEPSTVDEELSLGAPAWQQQWRPEFDVTPAYNPRSTLVPVNRIEGITWTMLRPTTEQSIVAGQGVAVTLDGRFDATLSGSRTLFVQMGSDADTASGGSRAAQFMLFDQAIREARVAGPLQQGALLRPAGREALARYLGGGRVVFHVNRAADIRAVIALARRSGMKPVLMGATEAWVVADELARASVPAILNPLANLPSDFDRLGSRFDNAARLQKAGVRIAFSTPGSHNARRVRQLAGNAVAHGLPWDAALAAITANPADIFGLGGTRGRIAAGEAGDLVLWSADPLEATSVAENVWIGGRAIEMRSRQTELRERYLAKVKAGQAR